MFEHMSLHAWAGDGVCMEVASFPGHVEGEGEEIALFPGYVSTLSPPTASWERGYGPIKVLDCGHKTKHFKACCVLGIFNTPLSLASDSRQQQYTRP